MSAIRDPNVIKFVKKLRISKTINEREMMVIYQCFLDNIKTEDQLVEVSIKTFYYLTNSFFLYFQSHMVA